MAESISNSISFTGDMSNISGKLFNEILMA